MIAPTLSGRPRTAFAHSALACASAVALSLGLTSCGTFLGGHHESGQDKGTASSELVSPSEYGLKDAPKGFKLTPPDSTIPLGTTAHLLLTKPNRTSVYPNVTVHSPHVIPAEELNERLGRGFDPSGAVSEFWCYPVDSVDPVTGTPVPITLHPVNANLEPANEFLVGLKDVCDDGGSKQYVLSYVTNPDSDTNAPAAIRFEYRVGTSPELNKRESVYWR